MWFRVVPALITVLSDAMSVSTENTECLVGSIQTYKTSVHQGQVQTATNDTVIPAGEVVWIRCPVIDLSDPLLLFEPEENSLW